MGELLRRSFDAQLVDRNTAVYDPLARYVAHESRANGAQCRLCRGAVPKAKRLASITALECEMRLETPVRAAALPRL